MHPKEQFGEFLRRRRELLSPLDVGLPAGARRRTPGLRRDEVAGLAHMSTRYYERLEQGGGPQPSAGVLARVAEVLRLSTDERDHLYLLAGHAAPVKAADEGYVDPGLASVLTAMDRTAPGFISDDLGLLVAQNRLNVTLFGRMTGRKGYGSNLIWIWFTSPEWRDRLEPCAQHEQTGLAYVADLRAAAAQRGHDSASTDLICALHQASVEFTGLWNRGSVAALHCLNKEVHDERVGRLDLECSVLTSPTSRQRLLLMQPVAGTPTGRRLRRLATHN